MKKKINNRKGFSLVELLAVIVILGLIAAIGITATSFLVDKAKSEKMDSQKNTVTLSAQTYLQNNKNLVPKIIGESKIIKVSDLRKLNYLDEDIKNNEGESCMEKSYVRVYKLSNTEYTYTTFLYCGSEEIPEEQDVPTPVVTAKFSDSSGVVKDDILNNVSDAFLYIEMNAASEDDIQEYKNNGTAIAIDGYSFTIFVTKNGKKQEAYNSGSLSGGREEKIIINKRLKDYIDVTDITQLSLEVTAINTIGGITNTSTTIGEHGEVDVTNYKDNVRPKCVKPDNPYKENDWLNKSEYNLSKDARKLTVGCDDGSGSGCIRNYFTNSWPNDDAKKGAEYVIIEVKDNAGNVSLPDEECKFRVNVDIQTPEATVTAYVGSYSSSNDSLTLANKFTGSNILKKTIKASDSSPVATIEPTEVYYPNLVGHESSNKWMNKAYYPNGVVYKIVLKDNIRLDKWTWNTNPGYINSTKSSNYMKVSGSNPEATSGSVVQDAAHGKTDFHGSTNDVIYVRFLTEGMRYGVLTVYDKAGNKVEVKIAAHLDRTAPPVPENLVANVYNKVRDAGTAPSSSPYGFKMWTNRYVRVKTAAGQNVDNLSSNTNLSGFWQFYYDARNHAGNSVGTPDYHTNSSGVGVYDFKGTAAQVDGKNKIRFMGCDKAGNCSAYGTYKEVWIDITIPVCDVVRTLNGSESSYGWLGIGESATVTAFCSEPTTAVASGCITDEFSTRYANTINTTTAGAGGNNVGGSFTDYAGNTIQCPANQRVQIDHVAPVCTVSGGSSKWTNTSRTVTGKCSDSGGSGCRGNISHTYNYDIETYSGGAAGNNNGGSIGDKADNYVDCAANQTVKVDRTNPYVTVNYSPGEYNGKITVTATCHDSLSGLSGRFDKTYTATTPEPIRSWNIGKCCEDNAGNSMCDSKGSYGIKTYGRHSDCGVESYKTCRTSGCGVGAYNYCSHKNCGTYSCKCKSVCTKWTCENCHAGTCKMYDYSNGSSCDSLPGLISKTCKTSTQKCSTCNHSCYDPACGVDYYNSCPDPACGVKCYNQCWHYGYNVSCSSGGAGGGGTNTMMTR
ncbi:MAG: type II secretion system protein [Bacilli bacterium]|nr:type II secretion system protein [Bacilli bacterium]